MKKILAILSAVIFFSLFFSHDAYSQCAMCRASVESNISTGKGKIGSGLNTGILYLMALPYLALGAVAYAWLVQYKKNKEKQQASLKLKEVGR
ncbi:MAG: hypothetical protein OHK0038_01530 [Flammeovirgaceae bacterium]